MAAERRPLIEGLKPVPEADPRLEKDFVYGDAPRLTVGNGPGGQPTASSAGPGGRMPVSTRIRADLAAALKRASLERQLEGVVPNTLQDILEEALEPWLRTHGYLS
jgi:hypothetical protein